MTAAHRSLPFGTMVKVTREDNGAFVYVRINDRGPFTRNRLIDLSRKAAEELGIIRRGHQHVIVEVVEEGLLERSEEHTSELQSLMRISYAVFCLKKKKTNQKTTKNMA